MRSDVHAAALKAAAKVAFSVAFVSGCGGNTLPPAAEGASEAYAEGADSTSSGEARADASCHDASVGTDGAADAATESCDAVLDDAFPVESQYPGTKKDVASDVLACCESKLRELHGMMEAHRWDCCANLSDDGHIADQEIRSACTPWGPPVPPAMTWGMA